MHILDCQHPHISSCFPNYDRSKSYIIFEGGSIHTGYYVGSFIVKIFRKGVFRFDTDKEHTKYKRIE